MIPHKPRKPLTPAVIEVFNGLIGEARSRAIATGNYDELIKQQQREPSQDDEWMDNSPASQG